MTGKLSARPNRLSTCASLELREHTPAIPAMPGLFHLSTNKGEEFTMRSIRLFAILVFIVLMSALLGACMPIQAPHSTASDVMFTWDSTPVGSSTLIRTATGVSATYETEDMTPGNAVTGWYIVFNHPELCEPQPFDCDPTDMFHPDYPGAQGPAEGDFLLLSGHVIGEDGQGNFEGTLAAGDASTSGLAEVICPETLDCTKGLTNPQGALIVLAAHDHGPAQTGAELEAQLNSFLGGCVGPFNGDDFGFAMSADDLPDNDGECSTIQVSPHMPDNG